MTGGVHDKKRDNGLKQINLSNKYKDISKPSLKIARFYHVPSVASSGSTSITSFL